MTLVGWVVAAMIFAVIALFVMVLYALYQRREVKAGLKIPSCVTLFFEAKDREGGMRGLKPPT